MRVRNTGSQSRSAFAGKKGIVMVAPGEVIEIPKAHQGRFLRNVSSAWQPVDPPAWPPSVKPVQIVPVEKRPGRLSVDEAKAAAKAAADRAAKSTNDG